jgi:uncharacterized protein Yka (UPF0111/DUF47 family)
MGIMDKLANKVTEAGVAMGNKANEMNLKSEIHKHELEIDKLFKEIGKIVYDNQTSTEVKEYTEQVNKITEHKAEIKKLQQELGTDEPKS